MADPIDPKELKKFLKNHTPGEAAVKFGTYTKRIHREMKKLGIPARTKSESVKLALKNGFLEHPTAGKTRPNEFRRDMAIKILKLWEDMPEEERSRRAARNKELWAEKTDSEKADFLEKSHKAIRKAATEGSKMEKFLHGRFKDESVRVQFHKKGLQCGGELLEVDLYLPDHYVAIEVDGPTHFNPVWGEEKLEQVRRSDAKKNGLIINAGLVMIRVQLVSTTESLVIWESYFQQLLTIVRRIKENFPPQGERLVEIKF
jgi:very-short-patch-repair endonuclease